MYDFGISDSMPIVEYAKTVLHKVITRFTAILPISSVFKFVIYASCMFIKQ